MEEKKTQQTDTQPQQTKKKTRRQALAMGGLGFEPARRPLRARVHYAPAGLPSGGSLGSGAHY